MKKPIKLEEIAKLLGDVVNLANEEESKYRRLQLKVDALVILTLSLQENNNALELLHEAINQVLILNPKFLELDYFNEKAREWLEDKEERCRE